ncbi:ABC transporter ATP-binding protein [Clostridium intestinale]|uniref:ABC transporter ATP-binding protein n=1 Tax=Clostridium intestinale TaxID=36845 RepID=UPI0028EE0CEC|nr:ABC transporter ATP-binding protein [Clostridium intestinale]
MGIIKLSNISKCYGSNDNLVQAIKGIDIDIQKGDLISIVGSSGSGKSTLLNILGLIDDFTSGEYILDNVKISELNKKEKSRIRNQKFGYVFQNFALFPQYTVRENLQIPMLYGNILKYRQRISYKKINDQVIEYLDKVNMKEYIDSKVSKLSGGQQQRVAIARALITNPDIILADEPTGALDSKKAKEILDLLIDINKEGKTIILVTHDEKIAKRCTRNISIEDGIMYSS